MVLGAAEALHALARRRAARIDVLGDRGRADEANRLNVGIIEDGVDRLLVAVDDVEDPRGTARFDEDFPSRIGTPGSRSEGFRIKAFPQAIAGASFHKGIIAGKLNGVMPATTPSGWRIE